MEMSLREVALRHGTILVSDNEHSADALSAPALAFEARLIELGYTLDEHAWRAVSGMSPRELAETVEAVQKAFGTDLNWVPLVKVWQTPTGETFEDHLITLFANALPELQGEGTTLPCGHFIPAGTFPLERYNGCPFCGRPFVAEPGKVYLGQAYPRRILTAWPEADLRKLYIDLLGAPVAPDGTARADIEVLAAAFGLPGDAPVSTKEAAVVVAAALDDAGKIDEARRLFSTPADIMRWLWFRRTGQMRVNAPKVLRERAERMASPEPELDLHYSRTECRRYADWLNALPMNAEAMAENMNPRRQMWVRFIRALRLPEMARRPGMEKLRRLLDIFYRKDYSVWAGDLEDAETRGDTPAALHLLQERPGAFARRLFSSMMRFGADAVIPSFEASMDELPMRLVLTLGMYARSYFLPEGDERIVSPAGGVRKMVPVNPMLKLYSEADRLAMVEAVENAVRRCVERRYSRSGSEDGTVYIAPELYDIPLPIGERSDTVQDASAAWPGQRFAVEGDHVRLFLQWGKGLPAQHLDMDLSAAMVGEKIVPYVCAYYSLTVEGATHSGDIREIPDMVGTAEYIELDIPALDAAGVKYAVFTCNAYSNGKLSPNLMVGWMDAAAPMSVSDETGVAYDPSTVSHIIRVPDTYVAKGLVFGVLDVAARSVIWLEMPFAGRNVESLDLKAVEALLYKLRVRMSCGEFVELVARGRGETLADSPAGAGEKYLTPSDALKLL